jgi:hypothetical protein
LFSQLLIYLDAVCQHSRSIDLGVKRPFVPLRNSASAEHSNPTFHGHPGAPALGLRQKPAFAQPINYNGRRVAISEECKTAQSSQIANVQIALHPGGVW